MAKIKKIELIFWKICIFFLAVYGQVYGKAAPNVTFRQLQVKDTIYQIDSVYIIGSDLFIQTVNGLYMMKSKNLISNDSTNRFLYPIRGNASIYLVKPDQVFLNKTVKGNRKPVYFRWWAWSIYVVTIAVIFMLNWIRRRRDFEIEKAKLEKIISERTAELMKEKEKTDELLANLLPKDTAEELKNKGKATSQKFNMVTVLFSDIQGFTKIAEQMNPERLIDELDNFFFHFDSVVEKYNIEKIKTIGDAYMCAGGIPYKNRTNPVEVVLAAIEIQEYMRQMKLNHNHIWDLRIGIHTGAVIAGVVGHKRMSYDIWGDTVNTASRMESSGQTGKVNISGQTHVLIKDFFICEYRGKMPVKYKGDVDMYFVKGIRPELSVDLKVIPNRNFFVQLQMLRLLDLEEYMVGKLNEELPCTIYFHNARYTRDVYTVAELLGRAENISQEDLLILKTAALLCNSGYLNNCENPEQESTVFARELLPKFKYSGEQIDSVCSLLLSLRFIENIKNKLESILIDAYLSYFGRVDFLEQSRIHFREMKERIPSLTEKEWFYHEKRKVERFNFYTSTAQKLREIPAEKQVQIIKDFTKLS